MKNLKLGISALALTVASTVFAQTTNNPWLIGVGAHAENHMAQRNNFSNTFSANNLTKTMFNVNNFSITPPLSKLTVARNVAKGFVVDWQTSVGNVENKRFNMGKEFFLMTGLGLQAKAAGILWNEESWFDPYLRVGANYLRHDYTALSFPRTDANGEYVANGENGNENGKANFFTVSTGAGANFWVTKNFGLGVQGDYVSTPGDKSNVANFWQASASLLFRFGNRDRDKDGILDKDDLCPDTPGLPEFQGCPDTDGDGVPDKDDQCPDVAGPVENNGCPWPDTDGDGVIDKDDACPTVAGPAENNGCPWPDTDGDGILDKDDACPTVPGLPEYNGCPKPKSVTATQVEENFRSVYFDFNKATIKPESKPALDKAAEIIKTDGGHYLLEGRTDAKGSEVYNLKLSRERAAAVVAALDARGVDPNALKSVGVGKAKATVPATASDAERQVDRKVVVTAIEDDAQWSTMKKKDYEDAPVKKAPAKKTTKKKVVKKRK
ncbi:MULTISPECIES: OmpA family protein [Chryseobacterium]|uniref:OOP family OmpA-OmpF porin n=1 Tax=Chryseobacterium camelliae TaxID=1265445 RepID=A0ABU0TPB1_9FLAO|nr:MULTISPECIES: OmpA family protein [Chryseobacterium]MDT3407491.1 OOP family OmpA-OmpF porin [Pseudacidovorax intermedius]MDQ1098656.1 OOP family OmpA-OmpF porin [Chryseobacterium camelliae]MDQ1102581.1 OOP family OmpA-OmpF porin [Chryseobacterium sp. SORGH_AS_1048]MDR6086014.1 OOP family OmpA-OmpF porin [Chryseobacterium sp. SORGH_AS_0909]MDR6130381.1 OOP family OmpA-OmpF porin [Chryseobacterium sp. SORGH_AS_1175]